MERNHTIMQFFEWHTPADGNHWKRLKELAPQLKANGLDSVWLPPVTKGQSAQDNGYGVYDHYDLGEFDQKGTIKTKYGSKEELLDAIQVCHENEISVYIDVVMNHLAGADETETFQVVEVDPMDRNKEISEPFEIEGWTKFNYENRHGKYSDFKWNYSHFSGTDYDQKNDRKGIFRIVGENKHWNENVDNEFGNFDYLMYADIDYNHPDVKKEMVSWGKWLADTTGCDGYRLDAIKHINHDFIKEFATELMAHRGENFYFVGEFWNPQLAACQKYLDHVEFKIDLFDVALHYKLHEASIKGRNFDLTTIFDNTLVKTHPLNAVTFVDNHDSQPDESLESWVEDWFKPSAYALILLRKDGYPCVFYGDFFGIGGDHPITGKKDALTPLLYARQEKAYGEQDDYFDHPNTIGWVRRGVPEIAHSGCAVVISNGEDGEKRMLIGKERAGQTWHDITRSRKEQITIGKDGYGVFPVTGGSVSVWAESE
ncbi:alpha-amylase [Heyndrickxia acidiproducens]|uniref:alpha-amylase n=1 Tax=Heyndrickxia acidiproducens TaxID=1121084 RepID=UPI000377BB58|nr:alpha-amylase [Heyndrickxia acidiproducens]